MKMARIPFLILVMIAALLAAACGGTASPTATTAPANNDTESNTLPTTGGPAEAVESFFAAMYAGEDPSAFACAASPEAADAYRQAAEAAASAMEGATVDASGLTYTVSDETAESATVTVEGTLTYTMSGVDTEAPFPATPVTVVNEDGSWKVCGTAVG